MKKSFWNKKFPTLFGVLLITIGISVTTFLINQGVLLKSNASTSDQPQNVRITNVTDSSFSVSYATDGSVTGSLNYGLDSKLGKSALDDRDQQTGNLASHKVHDITVRSLSPLTKYYFSITSGQNSYLNQDQYFAVTTGPAISEGPPNQNPLSGKVILSDGTSPKEAIIYATADNSQVISTLVKTDGSYILPLNSLRSADYSAYYTFPAGATVKMLIFGDSLTSNVSLSINQISPVPTVILSQNYDFRNSQSPVSNVPETSGSFPSFSSTSSGALRILTPQNNQGLTDQQPLFKGTGEPSQNVKIIIHSDQVLQTNVQIDKNGTWSYRPPSSLSPGTHTITIQAQDSSGVLQSITQSFIVYASGQQINPPAPSPTRMPTLTSTPTPTPTPTVTLKVTPTQRVVPTATPTLIPTATPTVAIIAYNNTLTPILIPSPVTKGGITISPTQKPLSPTGNPSIMTAGIVGAVVTIVGGLLFLLAL